MDSSLKNQKFGVVHTSPSEMISSSKLEVGKLYFAQGDASGAAKQGVYALTNMVDVDGVTTPQLTMFGTGAIADGTGYGLSQYNFDSDASTKLKNLYDASSNYLLKTSYVQVSDSSDGYVPKADGSAGTINSQDSNWVLTFDGTNVDWFGLPANAFKNDNSIYTGTSPIDVSGTAISHAKSNVSAGRYGDTSSKRELAFGGKFKVVDISVNEYGHVTDASTYELTLPSKPDTAGTADVANKLNKKLSINGIDFDGSTDVSLSVKGDGKTIDVSTLDGSVVIKAMTGDVSTNSSALTTGAQVANYVSTELGKLSGALIYKGVITAYSQLPSADASNIGHVYICSSSFTTTEAETGVKYSIEVGDMFISNGSKWNIVSSEFDVSTYSTELQWNTDVSIAVVDGVTIKAKLPANPNTDEKVKANTSTGKFYLIGQDDASSGTTETTYKNASVYVDGSALYSEGKKVLTGYTEQYTGTVKWVYPGTGLTNGTADSSIISTGTLNLKIATSNEIGGVKPGTTNGKTYGVQVNASTGEMTVNVPWSNDDTKNTAGSSNKTGTKLLLVGATSTTTGETFTNDNVYINTSNQIIAPSGTITSGNTALVTGGTVYTAIETATIYWETL